MIRVGAVLPTTRRPSTKQTRIRGFGIPKGHTGPAEDMFEAVNAGWMDLGVEGAEHVAGTTSARDVFAQNAAKA